MRFEGEIIRYPAIDLFAYYKSKKEDHRIWLMSDFETGRYDYFAVIYGKFDDSFCSGMNPLVIQESGDSEVEARIQLSIDLIERLKKDGETKPEHITILKKKLNVKD